MKVLNLYSGIGGNRKLWPESCQVTAVELDPIIAEEYAKNFPKDVVVVGDAKEYLLKHFQEFDFIWASPPCPTHSRMRTLWSSDGKESGKTSGTSFKLPDMDLYSLIIFLTHFCKKDWVVENVISYYKPLIAPYEIESHYFWSNKILTSKKRTTRSILSQDLRNKSMMPLPDEKLPIRYRRQMVNNCVKPELGLFVFNCIFRTQQRKINEVTDGIPPKTKVSGILPTNL